MIEIENIVKTFRDATAVDHVTLTIEPHTICALVGTSGSGKTTLLRMINRLVQPTSGSIRVDGQDVMSVPAYALRRKMGYVIQGHGLFPHWTIAQNVGTVPGLLGWDRAKIDRRVDELLDLFQLDPATYRDRMPAQLSGGQRQRVGVARALAAEPNILLMDEPFGALDPVTRGRAQEELRAIQARFGTTIVLVTHDMDEAILLGHRIAVMDKGRLLQCAPPAEIIARPATDFVRELVGTTDRAFRLLSLSTIGDHIEQGEASGDPLDANMTLRGAYSELLWSGRKAAPVVRDGVRVGIVSLDGLGQLAAHP
ncbi:osmoprotectant transport system ATP-binding protein [Devosia lucknowensis]|uniref:Osmoprotectant transport system ATP-binding protein n=1 Tax=Devosia lucknowensis TaxID=1096929 RepID=A0A1Y6G5L7_9HYPH|nr:ABC transporter ATP-binding protein [Devosia lucknowensis]SMQ85461.1 osmoprotectant transport system ATP-binding protein [Devosia lucknowensis]